MKLTGICILSFQIFNTVSCILNWNQWINNVYLYFDYETCGEPWIDKHATTLPLLLKNELYGQHIAADVVRIAIPNHFSSNHANKVLTISFHGWTGCGKNHVANLIARSLFRRGMKSHYVKYYVGTRDLSVLSDGMYDTHEFQNEIRKKLLNCGYSLFIFDELEFFPGYVLESLKIFMDYHNHEDSRLARNSIFLFLDNTGASDIARITLDHFRKGFPRESLRLHDFEKTVSKSAFNEEGAFSHSRLIKLALIDHYVPFLPLERKHVQQCIKSHSLGIQLNENQINDVLDALSYKPDELQLYSETGCKRIQQKIILFFFHSEL